jgi:hypothetical protein
VRRISRTMFVRAAEMVRRPGLFRTDNGADACRSFAAVEWHEAERLLGGAKCYGDNRIDVAGPVV